MRISKVVVFPAPLTPSSPKHSPLGMPREMPRTAGLGGLRVHPLKEDGYTLVSLLSSTAAWSALPLSTLCCSATTSISWVMGVSNRCAIQKWYSIYINGINNPIPLMIINNLIPLIIIYNQYLYIIAV